MPGEAPARFFEALSADGRRAMLARATTIRVGKGQTLIARGERSAQVFLVTEGRLQAVLYSSGGREVSLRDIAEGEMIGELAAIDGKDRSVSVVAATDARLLAIAFSDFNAVVRTSPDVADWMMRRLAAQVRDLTERIFELSALNVQTRLHCELLRLGRAASASGFGEVYPAPTHNELASRIGTHREAVTREMKALSDRNLIRSSRRRLKFLDLAELEALVARSSSRGTIPDLMS